MSFTILIDAGHGGDESGACSNGYVEKDLNLTLSYLVKEELERCGVNVLMTRTDDSNPSLSARGQMALDNDVLCMLSIHFNAFNGVAKGFEAIHTIYPDEQKNSASWIGTCISNEVEKLGLYKRGVWTKESGSYAGHNYYGVLRASEGIPSLILEGLFIDNINDCEFLKQPNFLKNLAKAYIMGLCVAYGWGYVEETISIPEPIPEPIIDTIPSPTPTEDKPWEQVEGEKALDNLYAKGLVNDVSQWKAKDLKNEPTPLWLEFLLFDRLSEQLKK